MSDVEPIRKWTSVEDGYSYRTSQAEVGFVYLSDYGNISYAGPIRRGSCYSVSDAKKSVEIQFVPPVAIY